MKGTGIIGERGGEKGGNGTHLCSSSSVLSSAAGYELCVSILEQVFIDAHVFFFREDGVVGLEAVLFQHCFISDRSFRVNWEYT